MDYAAMARFHFDNNADITVAVQPVDKREVSRYGILKRKPDCRITDFAEKPKDPAKLADLVSRDDPDRPYLGSMGIYLFKTETLLEMLEDRSVTDFGSDLIPAAIQRKSVYGYDFNGYWEDIGTIRSFYETNLALAMPNSPFNFFDQQAPIYTHARFLPPSVVQNTMMENVFMAEGCCIKNAEVRHSVIGLRSQIRAGAKIIDSFMMGSDYYDSPCAPDLENDARPNLGIGSNCHIEGAIIDKNAAIGRGTVIKPFPRGTDLDGDNWVVRDGIVVVVKNAVLPAGTYIGPEGGK
jgi:glucose-1-phosphate adenylyltransferase